MLLKTKSSSYYRAWYRRLIIGFCSAISFVVVTLFMPAWNARALNPPSVERVVQRNPDFVIPEKLRGRVRFWVDVFTRYGKNDLVFHHREFPQAIIGVLSFDREAETLGPVALDVLKRQRSREMQNRISAALRQLASGARPDGQFERQVEAAMSYVPGGRQKYQRTLSEELIRSQTGIREKCMDALRRSGRYIHAMERIFVQEYGLPVELTRIPFIESSFDYEAYSSVGAAGIWQFMRRTAKLYMTANDLIDERRDPIVSTRAAARYLRTAYTELGTWPLAITSYNHGVYGVKKKARMAGTTNLASIIEREKHGGFGFASANFFPEFLAALEVFDHPQQYFPGLQLDPPMEYQEVPITSATSVGYLSKKLGVDLSTLRQYNYAISDRIWSGHSRLPAGYRVKIPARGALTVITTLREPEMAELTPEPTPVAGTTSVYGSVYYRVRKGDTLTGIAKRYKTSVTELKRLNDLTSDAVSIGKTLIVKASESPRMKGSGLNPVVAKSAKNRTSQKSSGSESTSGRTHRVASGESLWIIAKKTGVSADKIARANGIRGAKLKPGQVLAIP